MNRLVPARGQRAPEAATAASGSPWLGFAVRGAEVDAAAATPSIALELEICAPPQVPIRAATLTVQVRIDVRRRAYDDATRERLREVFGAPEQWADSLRSVLWVHAPLNVGSFEGTTRVVLALPCTYDFEIAAAKLLHGLRDGVLPLELLFSGTVFHCDDRGALRAGLLDWEDGVRFDLPVELWRRAIDRFFPGSAWLRLDRELFDRLYAYRNRAALPSWEATLGALLERADEATPR